MENKKKTIFNVIFLLVVFTGTMYGVFHGEDIGEIVKILEQVNVLWLIPGVICVVVFIWGESIIIYCTKPLARWLAPSTIISLLLS